jgi:hypothetical protein
MSAKRRYLSSSILPLVAALPPIRGTWFFVDGTSGSDANDGLSPESALKTLYATTTTTGDTGAYAKLVSSRGDGLCILSSATTAASKSATVSAAFSWAKCGVTVFGVSSGSGYSSRARITNASTVLTAAYLFNVTGDNNRFENVAILNSGTDALALGAVIVTGLRNVFKKCHIVGGSCTTATANEYSVQIAAGAQENDFIDCIIGTDSIARGNNANCELYLNGDQYTYRNRFIRCQFIAYGTAAGAHVAIKSGNSLPWNLSMVFNDCDFICSIINKGADALSVFGGTAASGKIFMDAGCTMMGYAAWDTTSANTVYSSAPVGAATGGIAAAG